MEFNFWFDATVDGAMNDVACYVRWETAAQAQALYDQLSARGPETDRGTRRPAPTMACWSSLSETSVVKNESKTALLNLRSYAGAAV